MILDNKYQIYNLGKPQYSSSAANKKYVDDEVSKVQKDTSEFIKKDGTVSMEANLDMNSNNILNVKTPIKDTDGAHKIYIDETLSKSLLVSSSKENAFKYLKDNDESSSEYNVVVNDITDFNQSPHRNKKAYNISLQKGCWDQQLRA